MPLSTRASPPPPLSLGHTATKVSTAPVYSSAPQADTMRRSLSGDSMHSPRGPSRKASSPTGVNANSYCGRHTDQYLFGGRRITDLFRAIVKRD